MKTIKKIELLLKLHIFILENKVSWYCMCEQWRDE